MVKQPRDEMDAVASAQEYTGMLPAMLWDGDTGVVRRLLRVHRQPVKVYRKRKR